MKEKMLYTHHQGGFHHSPFQIQPFSMDAQMQVPVQQIVFSNRKLEHINCIIDQEEQSGALFIGDTISTLKPEYVINNNIKAVLCCNKQAANNIYMFKVPIDYMYLKIQDHVEYPIKMHFDTAIQFIDNAIKNKKNVLVQCHGGASRSVTLTLAYLMKVKGWSLEEAFQCVKEKRHRAKPNIGFWKQLEQYESILNKNKNEESKTNYKTPIKQNEDEKKMYLTPRLTNDKEVNSEEKVNEKEEQDRKNNENERAQRLSISRSVRSKDYSLDPQSKFQNRYEMQKKSSEIFADREKKRRQLRKSENFRTDAFHEEFKFRTPPSQKTFVQLKPSPQINSPLFFSPQTTTIHPQPFILGQPQQIYYMKPPQSYQMTYINSNNCPQSAWNNKAF